MSDSEMDKLAAEAEAEDDERPQAIVDFDHGDGILGIVRA